MGKSISKSIRISEEVFNYINNYRGDGFNQKFENIILDYQREEKVILDRIKFKRRELVSCMFQVRDALDGIRELNRLKLRVDNFMNSLEGIEKDLKALADNVSQNISAASDPEERNEIQRKKV